MLTNRFFRVAAALLPALLAFAACGDDDSNAKGSSSSSSGGPEGSAPPWSDPPPPVNLTGCDGDAAAPADKSTKYLLITENQLARMRAAAAANHPDFARLKANIERWLEEMNPAKSGGENAALLYLLTGDARYAKTAMMYAEHTMAQDLQGGTNGHYLEFGDYMRVVALTLNWTRDALDDAQVKKLADYLHASCDELWFHHKGSGWALSDDAFPAAGNNFRMGFIEGTAFAGYALQMLGDPRGTQWVDLAIDKLERKGGVFDYIDTYQSGGDWLEGTNYGQRSKQRLYRGLAVIASMGGKNYFNENPFFANSILYAIYQAQPGHEVLYPGGDLARSARAEISGYDREYVQIATYWLCDSPARRLGQYYLTTIVPSYEDGGRSFDYGGGYYLDLLYRLEIPTLDAATLPLSYRAAGTNWVNARSGWDEHATSISISGSPIFSQSHQHADMGSFVIWKEDWLAVDPESFGKGSWSPESHNGLFVPNREPRYDAGPVPGLTKYADKGAAVYVQVDNSNLYLMRPEGAPLVFDPLVNEHTREIVYLRPDTVFVFDRVDAKPLGVGYTVNFHFPSAPTKVGNNYTAAAGAAGITLSPLLGGAATAKQDTEIGSETHRVEVAATGTVSRFLNVIEVSSNGAPSIAPVLVGTEGSVRGALWRNTVVLFSDLPRGATPTLPLTYTVPGTGSPTHLLANMTPSAGYKVTATRNGGSTTVTVEAGGDVKADAEGLLVVTP